MFKNECLLFDVILFYAFTYETHGRNKLCIQHFFAVCGGTQFVKHRSAIDSSTIISNCLRLVLRDYQVIMTVNFQVTGCRRVDKRSVLALT
jgi:hypothetical protein